MSVGTIIRERLLTEPKRYQLQGIRFIHYCEGSGIIGDDMGLGKTYQAIGLVALQPEIRTNLTPAIVVCPASLKLNWQKEFEKHAGMQSTVIEGTNPKGRPVGDIWIVNYEIIQYWVKYMDNASHLIIDECFPYETMVNTDRGPLQIGFIVENKSDVKVLSMSSNKELDYKPITGYLRKARKTGMVKVHHSSGVLTCTENHNIWTPNGYVEAKDLEAGTPLRMVSETDLHGPEVLQHVLFGEMENESARGKKDVHEKENRENDLHETENGCGVGWFEPQESQNKVTRQKENEMSAFSRVERVEVLEQGCDEGPGNSGQTNFVYCLEVEGNHNFFADGVLVSNCHMIKNHKAIRTKATIAVGRKSRHVVGLSGTPIEIRPIEFYNILNLVAPREFPSRWKFGWDYCDPKKGWGGSWDFTGAYNIPQLHEKVKKVMIRRLKSEVLTELPPKTRILTPVQITNRAEYVKAEDDLIRWVKANKGVEAAMRANRAESFVRVSVLNQITARGKLHAVLNWCDEWFDSNPGQKLVLFTWHKAIMDLVAKHYPKDLYIDGGVKMADREAIKTAFQTDPKHRLITGQIGALGVGHTLTAAYTVGFLELAPVPARHDQAEDRVLRIGQTSDKMFAHYFYGMNTIEQDKLEIFDSTRRVVSQILNGEDTIEDSIHTQLLKSITKGRK